MPDPEEVTPKTVEELMADLQDPEQQKRSAASLVVKNEELQAAKGSARHRRGCQGGRRHRVEQPTKRETEMKRSGTDPRRP